MWRALSLFSVLIVDQKKKEKKFDYVVSRLVVGTDLIFNNWAEKSFATFPLFFFFL